MRFALSEMINPPSNSACKKVCFLSAKWCKRCRVFLDKLLFLRAFESVAVWELCVAWMDAYNVGRARFWHRVIDMDYILFRVQFQDGSSISLLRNRAHSLQKIGAQNRRVLKRSKLLTRTNIFQTPTLGGKKHSSWPCVSLMNEIGNPTPNFTWRNMYFLSIKWCWSV
jgi:hypothetical protein